MGKNMFTGSERIEMLGFEIIHLISKGYKENFDVIISKMETGTLITYLLEQYKNDIEWISADTDCPYNIQEWETILDEYSSIEFHHEVKRKMGIINKEYGFLFLLNIILTIVAKQ